MPSATTASAAVAKDLFLRRIRAPYRRSRRSITAVRRTDDTTRWCAACLAEARHREGGLAQAAILQLDQLVGIGRLVAARADVVHEAGRDAVIAQPHDLRQREIFQRSEERRV